MLCTPPSRSLTFQWGCGNYSGFGDGGAYDGDGVGDNEPAEFSHPCESPAQPSSLHLPGTGCNKHAKFAWIM